MAQEGYVLPTRRAARSQEGGVVSAGSTSPTSMQTKCTSHQLAPEEQEEEMAITSSYWIEIKGESRLPEQHLPQAQHRNLQPPSSVV